MPELPEMLGELIRELKGGFIKDCDHPNPALTKGWCDACFIKNHEHVSLDTENFYEETTEKQRETIERVYNRLLNEEDWDED